MGAWQKIDLASNTVVNVEMWDGTPPAQDGVIYHQQDGAGIGWTWDGAVLEPPTPPSASKDALKAAVMAKRDAVIGGGFTFNAVKYQTGDTDRENISGAAQLAFMAIVGGQGAAGNLRWADPNSDFGWIATDNSVVPMDAPTVVAFGKAAAGFKQACIFNAFTIKAQIDAASDPTTINIDAGWPA